MSRKTVNDFLAVMSAENENGHGLRAICWRCNREWMLGECALSLRDIIDLLRAAARQP